MVIQYNKLHAQAKEGKDLDIGTVRLHRRASNSIVCLVLKKVKHRLVESMSSATADALGLSRAILCNGKHPHTRG